MRYYKCTILGLTLSWHGAMTPVKTPATTGTFWLSRALAAPLATYSIIFDIKKYITFQAIYPMALLQMYLNIQSRNDKMQWSMLLKSPMYPLRELQPLYTFNIITLCRWLPGMQGTNATAKCQTQSCSTGEEWAIADHWCMIADLGFLVTKDPL